MKTVSSTAVIALLAGIILGVFVDPYLPASISNAKKGYQAGFEAAKMLVASSSVGAMFNTPADVRSLSGTVTAIHGDTLTLHVGVTDPFGDPALADRMVTIDASTTIVRLTIRPGSPATSKDAIPTPPLFTQTAVNLSGISIDDPLTVTAAENIATAKAFTATGIQIQARALSSASSTAAK